MPGQNSKTYTVAEVSEALGFTKQHVNRTIRELGLDVAKQGNKTVLTPCQADQIAKHLYKPPISTLLDSQEEEEPQEQPQENPLLDSVVITLQEQLRESDKQIASLLSLLESKDRQIDTLLETNKALSASQAAKQVAETKELLLSDNKPQEVSEQQPQKISFGQWLKSRFQA